MKEDVFNKDQKSNRISQSPKRFFHGKRDSNKINLLKTNTQTQFFMSRQKGNYLNKFGSFLDNSCREKDIYSTLQDYSTISNSRRRKFQDSAKSIKNLEEAIEDFPKSSKR